MIPARLGICLLSALSLLVATAWSTPPAHAQPVPKLTGRVVDLAELLTPAQRVALDRKLGRYERTTGHQFFLLTVPELEDGSIEDFSIRVAEQWKAGDAKRDDGLIMVISKEPRKSRIEVGYGLEGVVTDVKSKRTLYELLNPRLAKGDYAGGINAAFDRLMKLAENESVGESKPLRDKGRRRRTPIGGGFVFLILLVVFGAPFILSRLGANRLGGASVIGGLFGFVWGLSHGLIPAIIGAAGGAFLGIFFIGGGFGGGGGGGGG